MRKRMHLLWVLAVITACSRDKDDTTPEQTNYNKLITVQNFAGDTTAADNTVFLYSLEQDTLASISDAKSNDWDISFSGIFNTSIGGNNGTDNASGASFGSGGQGKGGVLILDKPFEDVTKVPDNAVFSTSAAAFGLDAAGFQGTGMGWCVYDFGGNLRPSLGFGGNGPTQKHTCWPRPDRTIIVRTAAGNFAKLKITSLYKDAPAEPVTRDAAPYFTFQYVIAAPGTRDFTIQ